MSLRLAMPTRQVVITRPLAKAELFANEVVSIGRTPVVFPLLEIRSLADQTMLKAALASLSSYVLVAFVGPNAIDAVFVHMRTWPDGVAIAIMGEGSRRALAKHGVSEANARIYMPLDPMRSDSETLLAALDLESLKGRDVLIVRGETGRELLSDALRSAGCLVTQIAAYQRRVPVLDAAGQQRLLGLLEGQNDWVVTSSEALRNLVQMVRHAAGEEGVAKLQRQRLLVSHARIRENARKLDFVNVIHAGSGDEQLIAALQSHP